MFHPTHPARASRINRAQTTPKQSPNRKKFAEFLAKQNTSLVAFEACATTHYWARIAKRHGNEINIIPAKAITAFRQGHKTDENDALAVAKAAKRPNIKVAPYKEIAQQSIQAIQRSREHLVQERTALLNHMRGLLMEFGLVIPQGFATLTKAIPEILEAGTAVINFKIWLRIILVLSSVLFSVELKKFFMRRRNKALRDMFYA